MTIFPTPESRQSADGAYQIFLKCIDEVEDDSELIALFSERFESELTPREIQAALEFYESPIGRKVVQRDLDHLARELDPSRSQEVAVISEQEEDHVIGFAATRVARKIRIDALLQRPEFAQKLWETLEEVAAPCLQQANATGKD